MFLVASVECLIPVCLCIGEVSTQLRVLGISQPPAEAAGFRVLDISQPLLLPVPIHSQISRILPIRLRLRLRLRLLYSTLLLLIRLLLLFCLPYCSILLDLFYCLRVFPEVS